MGYYEFPLGKHQESVKQQFLLLWEVSNKISDTEPVETSVSPVLPGWPEAAKIRTWGNSQSTALRTPTLWAWQKDFGANM